MSKAAKRKNNFMLPGLEDFDAGFMDNIEGDPSLEAELLQLVGSGSAKPPMRQKDKKQLSAVPIDHNLLKLDVDDEVDENDFDENDPELLAELNSYLNDDSPIEEKVKPTNEKKSIPSPSSRSENVFKLENLQKLYQDALKESMSVGEASKTKRYERSLNIIKDLLKKAQQGIPVDESEFPPPVFVKSVKADEKPEAVKSGPPLPVAQKPTIDVKSSLSANKLSNPTLIALVERQNEYKSAAIVAKQKDIQLAKGLMTVVKQFDEVIASVKQGEPFDLSYMPLHPSEFKLSDLNNMEDESPPVTVQQQTNEKQDSVPKSFIDELKSRQDFYRVSIDKAKSEDNMSKVRRLTRLIQQYDEAITAFNKKQSYPYEELPPPPGKPPLLQSKAGGGSSQNMSKPPLNQIVEKPATIVNKNLKLLLQRQSEFKAAALKAKKDNDIPLAKELLKQAKGFDQMIEAAESGFPVDLSQIPSLPTDIDNFEFQLVNVDICETPNEMLTADKPTLFKQLQLVLIDQIKTCKTYQQNMLKAGDVISAKRFETIMKSCETDLNGLKCLIVKNADIPKFHYEYKMFSITKSNPDLGENELSLELIKGTDFAIPSGFTADQLDTYVVLELPFPTDNFQKFTTETIRKTNSPLFNAVTKFEISPKSRAFQRVVKSKCLKAEIFYRKGFLQKDKLLGTSNIKLEKLETECSIHECFDIVENRKVIGGQLEVRLRVRHPLLAGSQLDSVKEKWLVIDDFNRNSEKVDLLEKVNSINSAINDGKANLGSIDVLKYELVELKKKLSTAGSNVNISLATQVRQKIRNKEELIRKQEEKLHSLDPAVRLAYVQYLSKLPQQYTDEAKKQLATGNRDKANTLMTKKKLVDKEIERIK